VGVDGGGGEGKEIGGEWWDDRGREAGAVRWLRLLRQRDADESWEWEGCGQESILVEGE